MKEKDIDKIVDNFMKFAKDFRKKAKNSPYLKKMIPVTCKCSRQKSNEKMRAKYGVCNCDTFSMSYTLCMVIHNYLQNFLANADGWIAIAQSELKNWDKVKWCAEVIKDFAEADSWDTLDKDEKVKNAFLEKEKNFKEAMQFLVDNWGFFWW